MYKRSILRKYISNLFKIEENKICFDMLNNYNEECIKIKIKKQPTNEDIKIVNKFDNKYFNIKENNFSFVINAGIAEVNEELRKYGII